MVNCEERSGVLRQTQVQSVATREIKEEQYARACYNLNPLAALSKIAVSERSAAAAFQCNGNV